MAANSVLLDFSIEPNRVTDESSRKDIIKVIKENLEKYFGNLKTVYDMLVDDGYLLILSDNSGVICTLRFFNEGLITLNIEYFRKESEPQRISFEVGVNFSFSPHHISHSTMIQEKKETFWTGFSFHSLFRAHSRNNQVTKLFFTISNYMLRCHLSPIAVDHNTFLSPIITFATLLLFSFRTWDPSR